MSRSFIQRILPAILALVFTILSSVLIYVCFYIDGIKGHLSLRFIVILLPYLMLMLLLAIWAIIVVWTSFRRVRAISRESILSIVILVIVVAAPFIALSITTPGAKIFIQGYKSWVMENFDVDLIQDWIAKAPDYYWNERKICSYEAKPDGFPPCSKDCEFQYVSFEHSDLDSSKVIRLEYGGGMSHWGIVVGPPEMKMPDKTEYRTNRSSVEFRKVIKPGAYVYNGE